MNIVTPIIRTVFLAILYLLSVPNGGFADQPGSAADDIALLSNLQYRDGVKACILDLAMPKQSADKPRGAIVVIHGGGWLEGDKSSFTTTKTPGNIIDFAKLGFVAVTINYRLSGEAPFPAALDDCRCAVRWLRANAVKYHVDPTRIGAWGNSAGGHLALLLGLMPPPKALDKQEPCADQSSQVQAVVSDSGPIDLLTQYEHKQLVGVIEKFMGGPPDGARVADYQRASPVHYVSEKIPPLLLIYGAIDTQVDVLLTDQFVASLGRAGAKDVSYIRLAQVDQCPHSLIRIGYLQQVVDQFFLRTLKSSAADSIR